MPKVFLSIHTAILHGISYVNDEFTYYPSYETLSGTFSVPMYRVLLFYISSCLIFTVLITSIFKHKMICDYKQQRIILIATCAHILADFNLSIDYGGPFRDHYFTGPLGMSYYFVLLFTLTFSCTKFGLNFYAMMFFTRSNLNFFVMMEFMHVNGAIYFVIGYFVKGPDSFEDFWNNDNPIKKIFPSFISFIAWVWFYKAIEKMVYEYRFRSNIVYQKVA